MHAHLLIMNYRVLAHPFFVQTNMASSLAPNPLHPDIGRRLQLQFREQEGRQGRHGLHCCIVPQCGRERSTVPYWNLHVYATSTQSHCRPFLYHTVLVLCCSLLLTASPSLISYLFCRGGLTIYMYILVCTCRCSCKLRGC